MITSPAAYLDDPVRALYVWEGGLGIPGGISAASWSAWSCAAGAASPPGALADAIAPGVVLAQAIGRFGNWFNQELYGRPTDAPVGARDRPGAPPARAARRRDLPPDLPVRGALGPRRGGVLLWADRRWRLGGGRVFALYLALYAVGRGWIEALRDRRRQHLLRRAAQRLRHGRRPRRRPGLPRRRRGGGREDGRRSATPSRTGRTLGRRDERRPRAAPSPPSHHHHHRDVTGGWLRPAVFGVIDGLVSNTALIAGVAGGGAEPPHGPPDRPRRPGRRRVLDGHRRVRVASPRRPS